MGDSGLSERSKEFIAIESLLYTVGISMRDAASRVRELGKEQYQLELSPTRYTVLEGADSSGLYVDGVLVVYENNDEFWALVAERLVELCNVRLTRSYIGNTKLQERLENEETFPATLDALLKDWGYTGIGKSMMVGASE